jgi:8-oxo-dGTP pyrophosphatase MutT (NUDIX family)
MDRAGLLQALERYVARYRDEQATVDRVRALLESGRSCFSRDCFDPGHLTASAWIVSREHRSVLLTHHRKLDRWLQLGGHADGETDLRAVALREAREESGMDDFRVLRLSDDNADGDGRGHGGGMILDVDVHVIPAHGDEPRHEHHDIRFLLETSESIPIRRQRSESKAMGWFRGEALESILEEESLARMARKASDWLARSPIGPD